ncbi:MAG: methyltransferase domain-containing protein [Chloroflexi bacterium]|nr:methyltransferase domain-containing protein [Chloroflexota bacterium]
MPAQFDTQKQFVQWNEAMAHKYDPEAYHLRSNFLIRWIERRRVKTILKFLNTDYQDHVLEIGCGAGNILEQIPSKRLHGIDLSTFLTKKSQHRLASYQAILALSNAEQLPFADGRFRKLVCSEVLEHVSNPRRVICEMARVATTDAVLVISVPNEAWIDYVKGIIRRLGLGRWLLKGGEGAYNSPTQMTDEWHLHSFDLLLLYEIIKNILVIRQTQAIPFSFLPLRYVARCQLINQSKPVPHANRNL